MTKKNLLLTLVLLAALTPTWAQGPNGSGTYYKLANGRTGAALKTAMGGIINPHTNIGYDGLFDAYKKTDKRADGKLRDWYSNTTNYDFDDHKGSYQQEGDMYNREHSVPQSWFGSGVIKADVVHVLPTDGYVNNRRSNHPFAEVNSISWQSNNGYSKLGSCKTAGYSGTVFEPNDEIKGDIARIYFYMVTCYESQAASWGHSVFSTAYNGFEKWTLDMLMRWSKQDPVDAVEIARNNAVYDVQKNRNPFVDYPGLEDYIWGDKKGQAFSYDNYEGGGGDVNIVAMPVITPDAGTYYNSVDVTISCATDGATVYYTTNGVDASEQSHVYTGPFTLTESATVKAIAVKDGDVSFQATADYRIVDSSGDETPAEGTIMLCNQLFGTSYTGSISNADTQDLIGTQNGVTVNYSLGSGANRYCNDSQIRLYQKNRLTISVAQGELTEIEFTLATTSSKKLQASTGTINDLTWKGKASSVTFNVDDGSGNMQLTKCSVKLDGATSIAWPDALQLTGRPVIYNLQGQPVEHPRKGIYVVHGKKVVVQ